MRWNQDVKKKVSSLLKIWFFVLFLIFTSITAVQTIHYLNLKGFDSEILHELNETDMVGYDEAVELNRTFNFGSYLQPDLFDNYRYEFYNVVNNMTLNIQVDNAVVIRTIISTNETYHFTFHKRFTPIELELDVFSTRSIESLQFNLRIIQLTNSQELAKFASEYLEIVISEIFMLVLFLNWLDEKSWFRNLYIQGIANSILTILILRLKI